LRRSLFHTLLLVVALSLALSLIGGMATACERCRALGTTALHDPSLGGDDPGDALFGPLNDDLEGGSGEFVWQGAKWNQPGGLGSPVTLTYSYQNMFDGGLKMPNGQPLPATLIRKSIEEALGLWASVAPLTFIEVEDDGLTYAQGSTQFGQIRFRHVYINGPDPPPPALPVAKAQAYYPSGSGVLPGDVEFDHGDPWQEIGTLPQPDILGATIHELGHSLGLAHTSVTTANMYWIFTRYSGLGTGALHTDDIAGIQLVYGAGSGRVIPLAIPEPAAQSLVLLLAGFWWLTRRLR
jgi:hypothetical protein